jgi:hypothetical protein
MPPSGGSRDQTCLRPQSPQNRNIHGAGRRLSAISTSHSANGESGDVTEYANSSDFRSILASLAQLRGTQECLAGAGGFESRYGEIRNRMLLPAREDLQNPISSEFINTSKHSNFENRTESAESRDLERIEPFGEEWSGSADWGIQNSNQKSLPLLGLIAHKTHAENMRLRPRWRRECQSIAIER